MKSFIYKLAKTSKGYRNVIKSYEPNAKLTIKDATKGYTQDKDGNYIPNTPTWTIFDAHLNPKKPPDTSLLDGVDLNSIYLEGYLLNETLETYPKSTKMDFLLNGKWNQGLFTFVISPTMAWSENSKYYDTLGQKIRGWFSISS